MKKQEANKETAKELWNRLSELNKQLKDIRENKKKKKISKTVLKA